MNVITLKDGRRVFDHSGEHEPGGRIRVAGEQYEKHPIVAYGAICVAVLASGKTCYRSINHWNGHWRHNPRPYVNR